MTDWLYMSIATCKRDLRIFKHVKTQKKIENLKTWAGRIGNIEVWKGDLSLYKSTREKEKNNKKKL